METFTAQQPSIKYQPGEIYLWLASSRKKTWIYAQKVASLLPSSLPEVISRIVLLIKKTLVFLLSDYCLWDKKSIEYISRKVFSLHSCIWESWQETDVCTVSLQRCLLDVWYPNNPSLNCWATLLYGLLAKQWSALQARALSQAGTRNKDGKTGMQRWGKNKVCQQDIRKHYRN